MRRPLSSLLLLALGCASPATTPTAAEPDWPEPPLTGGGFTLVHRGARVEGTVVALATGPAGLGEGVSASFVLTNRGEAEVVFDGAWLSGADAALAELAGAPAQLAAGASVTLSLWVDEPGLGHDALEVVLVIPGTDLRTTLDIEVPPPLRAVGVGSGGYTVISDDYGATWQEAGGDLDETRHHSITWGGGRFLRTWAAGTEWSDPGRYAWSADGLTWTDSAATDEFWSSGCVHGLEQFVCARGDALSWSSDGGAVVHEATTWGQMNHAIGYADGLFVGVGRSLRRVRSEDGRSWRDEQLGEAGVNFNAVVFDGQRWVAAGGSDGKVVATSPDADTWTFHWWPERQYASWSRAVVHQGRTYLSGNQPPYLVVDDGAGGWEELLGESDPSLNVLASLGPWLIAGDVPWEQPGLLYRSLDGLDWELVHTTPAGLSVDALAVEAR